MGEVFVKEGRSARTRVERVVWRGWRCEEGILRNGGVGGRRGVEEPVVRANDAVLELAK